ncbi:BnaC09g29760D [Brassica napus]|uniref:BnaC09g29760D protein n=1 Tax=Brassica napus TaxID=3708 RepID=A0A078HDY7_BRANA|nr:BnaC09g29760D [Brassica napus]
MAVRYVDIYIHIYIYREINKTIGTDPQSDFPK